MKTLKMMIAQRKATFWLARLQSGDIETSEQDAFFDWLQKSSLNQAAYIQAESLWHKGEPSERHNTINHQSAHRSSMPTTWMRPLNLTASGIAAVCLAILLVTFNPSSYDETFKTSTNENETITLKDGSTLTLAPNSTIHVKFERTRRLIILEEGHVFFDVTPNPSLPFDIDAGDGLFRVLGTEFSIKKTETENKPSDRKTSTPNIELTVVEGKVGIFDDPNSANEKNNPPNTVVVANEKITIHEAKSGIPARKVDAQSETAWTQGRLVYKGEPLEKLILDIESYSDVKIRLSNEGLGKIKVHAVLDIKNIDASLKTLAESLNLKIERPHPHPHPHPPEKEKEKEKIDVDTQRVYTLSTTIR